MNDLTFQALFNWAVLLAKSPRGFLRDMAKKGGYGTPILYLAFWSTVSSLIGFLFSFARPASVTGSMGFRLFGLIASPLLGVIVGLVLAAILFVIWHLMGSREDFQTSFRVWSFISPLWAAGSLLGFVPYLGFLVFLAFLYLVIVASEEVHGLPRTRSWIVWGIVGAFLFLFLLGGLTLQKMAQNMPNFPAPGR
jgi:hypothetical protein